MSDQIKNNFLPIIHNWPEYFITLDEGIGTTYERLILHRFFKLIKADFDINSVLEAPSFGMTGISGINSLWWAAQGTVTTIVDNDADRIEKIKNIWKSVNFPVKADYTNSFSKLPYADCSFDLVWNFAALWFVEDLSEFFKEMDRISKSLVFICIPNNMGLGYILRSLFTSKNIPDFYPGNILPKKILSEAGRLNWKVIKKGFLDIPLWPDIPMKKEDLLKKAGLGFLIRGKKNQGQTASVTNILDFFYGSKPDLERQYFKYAFLENAPFPIKQLWGHHRYFIFKK